MNFSPYRIMWIFVFFDLPTETKTDRRAYSKFRKALLQDGFTMHQYSVYIRHCVSIQNMEVHIKKVEKALPKKGHISILSVTDKQFEMIKHYWGIEPTPPPDAPQQMEIF